MELKDLCGQHVLQGVDYNITYTRETWDGSAEDVTGVLFRLDGVSYLAIEDPDDGWRSRCEELVVVETIPRHTIPDAQVVCSMMEDSLLERNDVLVVRDSQTGEIVLEVGTMNWDDWYPYCHFEYRPENLACNKMGVVIPQQEIIINYLESAYIGARASDDVETMTRIARAIIAFKSNPEKDYACLDEMTQDVHNEEWAD